MTLKEYLIACKRTSRGTSTKKERLINFALGLSGEASEINELINGTHVINIAPKNQFDKVLISKEVGDLLWYVMMFIHEVYGREDFSAEYETLTKWGKGKIVFVGYTDYYDHKTKCINIGLITTRISTLAGAVSDAIKKHIFHDHPLDSVWVIGQLGDIFWLCEFFLRCCSLTIEEVMEKNIEKLKERYPEGFTKEHSLQRIDQWNGQTGQLNL